MNAKNEGGSAILPPPCPISFRRARPEELDRLMAIYAAARAFMRESGNPTQWPEGYPPRESVAADIGRGAVYVATDGREILAVFSYEIGREPVYDRIDGAWLTAAERYGFMHRLAVSHRGGGIGAACLDFCFSQFPDLRIDTHESNRPMQALLQKCGFSPCGTVDYGPHGTRIAYEKHEKDKG